MATIICVHSFRGGTGKSNTTANVAAELARRGLRVGVIDTDIQSPGIHVLFGLNGESITASLNDYLWGGRPIGDAAQDVTPADADLCGKIYLIPSSIKPGEITRVLREGYDAHKLTTGLRALVVVNNTPHGLDPAAVKARVERAYGCEVAAVLPHSDEMMTLASEGIFSIRYPDHPLTALYRRVADRVIGA